MDRQTRTRTSPKGKLRWAAGVVSEGLLQHVPWELRSQSKGDAPIEGEVRGEAEGGAGPERRADGQRQRQDQGHDLKICPWPFL